MNLPIEILSMPIGEGQKAALFEAFTAAVSLLPFSLQSEFLVIGGTSLILMGSSRKTEDVDFAVSAAALHAFVQGAHKDSRFSLGADGD